MLKRSARKRAVPTSRQDYVAVATKTSRRNIAGSSGASTVVSSGTSTAVSSGTFNTSVVGSVHMDPVIICGYPPVSAYYSQPQSTSFALSTRPITVASTAVPVSSSCSIGPNDQVINELLNM